VQNNESVETFLHEAPACLLVKYSDQASITERIRRLLRRYLAVEFLTQSDLPLLEVAACVGFSEASTFHRAFKGWTGMTPGAYRKAHNEPVESQRKKYLR
jgi:AraC-like DNA-binding protein